MSDLLSLFPLPNVVLFPGVFLPLHIFEPRYREMVADALRARPADRDGAAARRLGARLRGRPPVYADRAAAALITHCEKLPDGRYNIVLRGLDRFRIVGEDHARSLPAGVDRAAAGTRARPRPTARCCAEHARGSRR